MLEPVGGKSPAQFLCRGTGPDLIGGDFLVPIVGLVFRRHPAEALERFGGVLLHERVIKLTDSLREQPIAGSDDADEVLFLLTVHLCRHVRLRCHESYQIG